MPTYNNDNSAFNTPENEDVFASNTGVLMSTFLDSQRLFDELCTFECGAMPAATVTNMSSTAPMPIYDRSNMNNEDSVAGMAASFAALRPGSPCLSEADSISSISSSQSSYNNKGGNINDDAFASQSLSSYLSRKERNRQAAERCRRKKAQLIQVLQNDCKTLEERLERVERENAALRSKLAGLQCLLPTVPITRLTKDQNNFSYK